MKLQWPFASEAKEKQHLLESQIKELQKEITNKEEESEDVEVSLKRLEEKVYNETDQSSVLGTFGVVDEYFDKAMLQRLYCSETWFYIAVKAIAEDISALPIKLEKKKMVNQSVSQADGSKESVKRETWIDASGEPEFKVLKKPNSLQTAVEFWMLVVIDLLATGDAFIYVDQGEPDQSLLELSPMQERLQRAITRGRRCNVRGMYRLSSALVQPVAGKSDKRILDGYALQTDAGYFTFAPDEVIHIRLPNPSEPFYGLAPIVAVMKKLLLDRYTDEHMLRFYKQGARLGGVIKTKKKLTKEQLIRLERVFESNFTGKRNHHKTLVLPEEMEYQTIEQNPGETALIEFTKANKEPILAAYKVPPIKVGLLDGATYANANIQDKTYYQNTIKPLLTHIEQAINEHGSVINPLSNMRMRFDLSEVPSLAEDVGEKAKNAQSLKDSGLSVNEIREMVWKKGPIEGGEVVPLIESTKASSASPFSMLSAKPGETKTDVPNVQNDTSTLNDIQPTGITYSQRVGQLVATAIAAGIDPQLAAQQAVETALQEGFKPEEVTEQGKKWGRFTREQIKEHIEKMTGSGIAPLIEAYKEEVDKMFDRLEKLFIKELNKHKSFDTLIKTKADDTPDVLDFDMDFFVDGEIESYTKSQWSAMRKGFSNTLSERVMTFPNERAQKVLEEIGTQHLKSVTGTAKDRVKRIIVDAYQNQTSVTEIASLIRDEFTAMKAGKANTIARTETLTAVSLGQRTKVEEFKSKFPQDAKRMKKVWASAEGDRVRDSHAELDGVSIPVDQKFANGLMFPRDPNGEAKEVINCRCTTIEYLAEDEGEVFEELSDSVLADAADQAEKSAARLKKAIENKKKLKLIKKK